MCVFNAFLNLHLGCIGLIVIDQGLCCDAQVLSSMGLPKKNRHVYFKIHCVTALRYERSLYLLWGIWPRVSLHVAMDEYNSVNGALVFYGVCDVRGSGRSNNPRALIYWFS